MDTTIDPHVRRRTLLYIIIGIILVVVLGVYIYITIINQEALRVQHNVKPVGNQPIMLTEQQSLIKASIVNEKSNEQPVPLTPAQAAAKEAILRQAGATQ